MRSPALRFRPRGFSSMAPALLLSVGLTLPAAAADRALLVGIDDYADPRVPETPGAVDDARATARLLQERFGFAPESIRLLLDEEATAAAVVDAFRTWLVEGTAPGDRVFFLYAGHGSQLPDDDGDEEDGFDETLAPHDVEALSPPEVGAGQIRDDLLDALVASLSGRRAVLVFDSCHSGTVTRALPGAARPGVRYLPRVDQLRALVGSEEDGESLRSGALGWKVRSAGDGADARVVDDPAATGRMAGVVVLSAAQPGQLAYPLELEEGPRGALTWLFDQAVRSGGSRGFLEGVVGSVVGEVAQGAGDVVGATISGGSGSDAALGAAEDVGEELTVAALGQLLSTGMDRLQSAGSLPGGQEPVVEVLSEHPIEDQGLFGGWQQEPAVALTNPVGERRVSLGTVGGRTVYESGESVVFRVGVDGPGWLYLLVFSEGRKATCLFPNPDDPDNRLDAGERRLPPDDSYVFPVGPPYGIDVAVALVADRPLPLCEEVRTTWDAIYESVDLRSAHEALRARVEEQERGIGFQSVERPGGGGEPEAQAPPDWQSAAVVIETRRPGS